MVLEIINQIYEIRNDRGETLYGSIVLPEIKRNEIYESVLSSKP